MPAVKSSDGPVAVTGASGYVGSHVVVALMKRGYTVHACVTDLTFFPPICSSRLAMTYHSRIVVPCSMQVHPWVMVVPIIPDRYTMER